LPATAGHRPAQGPGQAEFSEAPSGGDRGPAGQEDHRVGAAQLGVQLPVPAAPGGNARFGVEIDEQRGEPRRPQPLHHPLSDVFSLDSAVKPRLIYRTHPGRRRRRGGRKGLTEADCARLLDAAHQQLGGPIVLIRERPQHPCQRRDGRDHCGPVLADGVPAAAYAHELNPLEPVWAHLKQSLANLTKHTSPS
jgi:hypothetical protein